MTRAVPYCPYLFVKQRDRTRSGIPCETTVIHLVRRKSSGERTGTMYRQYEDPYTLEQQLKEKEAELAELRDRVNFGGEDMDILIDVMLDIEELKERINFAWQDDEAG